MGAFFTLTQILNQKHESKDQFIKSFCAMMKKQGYVPATEDDSELTYTFSFSENSDWVRLDCEKYETSIGDVAEDAGMIADGLKTCCIIFNIVDSEFAEIGMFDKSDKLTDRSVAGDASEYMGNDYYTGSETYWKPYICNGYTWDDLLTAWRNNNLFVEENIAQMADVLGMDNVGIDGITQGLEENTEILYLKNISQSKGKKMSLNTAFKHIFGEGLAPYGFKKIKGKQPYFVRVVDGGEIIHVVTYINERSTKLDAKAFNIMCGVATVYRSAIDLTISPMDNKMWLNDNFHMYTKIKPFDYDPEFRRSIFRFNYDDESMIDSLYHSLDITKEIMLPELDKVVDIKTCIEKGEMFCMMMHLFDEKENYGINNKFDEGFLYIKTHDIEGIRDRMEKRRERIKDNIKEGRRGYTQEDLRRVDDMDSDIYINKILALLEKRKMKNIETLRSYGLDL